MSTGGTDAQLLSNLQQAKNQKMYFAALVKGKKGALVVAKSKVSASALDDAKKKLAGSIVLGSVTCENDQYKFACAGGSGIADSLKAIIQTSTGKSLNCVIVDPKQAEDPKAKGDKSKGDPKAKDDPKDKDDPKEKSKEKSKEDPKAKGDPKAKNEKGKGKEKSEEEESPEAEASEKGKKPKLDKVLQTQLGAAKSAKRFFALVGTSAEKGKLLLASKPVGASLVAAAKEEFQASACFRGVVEGEKGKLFFRFPKKAPGKFAGLIKALAKRDTGLSLNVRLAVLGDLTELGEEGAGDDVPAEEVATLDQWEALAAPLREEYKAAKAAGAEGLEEVAALYKASKQLATDKKFEAAIAKLDEFEAALDKLDATEESAETETEEPEQQDVSDSTEEQETQAEEEESEEPEDAGEDDATAETTDTEEEAETTEEDAGEGETEEEEEGEIEGFGSDADVEGDDEAEDEAEEEEEEEETLDPKAVKKTAYQAILDLIALIASMFSRSTKTDAEKKKEAEDKKKKAAAKKKQQEEEEEEAEAEDDDAGQDDGSEESQEEEQDEIPEVLPKEKVEPMINALKEIYSQFKSSKAAKTKDRLKRVREQLLIARKAIKSRRGKYIAAMMKEFTELLETVEKEYQQDVEDWTAQEEQIARTEEGIGMLAARGFKGVPKMREQIAKARSDGSRGKFKRGYKRLAEVEKDVQKELQRS